MVNEPQWIDQRYAEISDLHPIIKDFYHWPSAGNPELLVNHRIRNQLANGSFGIHTYFTPQRLAKHFIARNMIVDITNQAFKASRVSFDSRFFIFSLNAARSLVTNHAKCLRASVPNSDSCLANRIAPRLVISKMSVPRGTISRSTPR